MIEIKEPESRYSSCIVCNSKDDILDIYLESSYSGGSNTIKIVLCAKCRDELLEKLTGESLLAGLTRASEAGTKALEKYDADHPKIVRCKDCAHGISNTNYRGEHGILCHNKHSSTNGYVHNGNWFCADGERR